MKGNCLRFRYVLNGQIDYEIPNCLIDKMDGFLKLKTDPRTEIISINNVILRNSIIHYSRW